MPTQLSREQIIHALHQALQPLSYTCAMWEGGAVAFNRFDQWSDIDLMVDVEDEHVAEAMQVIEQTLNALSPIDLKYELPQPTWHGHAQSFFRLKDAGPFLLVDVCVLYHSKPNKFLEPEMHGKLLVHFDKCGVVRQVASDPSEMARKLLERAATLKVTFDMFQSLTTKELNRGNWIEALAFYNGYTLRPLVEALRILHQPQRYSFHTRYIHYDLPPQVVQRLERLYFVANGEDLRARQAEAQQWFYETFEQIN
ncbi:MAG: nucleotidyltransferase domain-containing protein [Chloroflexota bacterium]